MAIEKVDFEFQTSHQNPQVDCIHGMDSMLYKNDLISKGPTLPLVEDPQLNFFRLRDT